MLIAGVLAVVALRRRAQEPVQAEMESSAERLQSEMQRSADEIISRLSERIDQLEKLVEEADQRSAQLEWQLARVRDTGTDFVDTEETDNVSTQAEPEEESEFSRVLQESLNEAEYTTENEPIRAVMARNAYSASAAEATSELRLQKVETEPQEEEQPQEEIEYVGESFESLMTEMRTAEDSNDEVLQEEPKKLSFGEETEEAPNEAWKEIILAARRATESNHKAKQPETTDTNEKVRELFSEGYSTEEISRRLHLGRGAIELIKQMDSAGRAN